MLIGFSPLQVVTAVVVPAKKTKVSFNNFSPLLRFLFSLSIAFCMESMLSIFCCKLIFRMQYITVQQRVFTSREEKGRREVLLHSN